MRWNPCIGLILVLLLPSCTSAPRGRPGLMAQPFYPDTALLRQRAQQLWTARVEENWKTAHSLQDPRRRESTAEADFVDWHEKSEPFKYHEFEVGRVQSHNDLGWVEVDCRTSARRYPGAPPRRVKRWEKWRVVDGEWYPVPRRELERYPEAPARRDAAEEERLLARFEEAWQARCEHAWDRLYELTDPRDHEDISAQDFAAGESLFEHLSCELKWVEVIGDCGRVRALYEIRMTDPNLNKMSPEAIPLTERWVKLDGDWYRDLLTTRQ